MKLVSIVFCAAVLWPALTVSSTAAERLPSCNETALSTSCVLSSEERGPWTIEEVVPRVGSQNAIVVSTPSFEQIPGLFGRDEPAILMLACKEGVTQLEVSFGENFMSGLDDFGKLVYKVDNEAPVALQTEPSEDRFSLGVYDGTQASTLIETLFGSTNLLVTATSFTGRNMTASFAIDGVQDAVTPLRTLCNW
ncbi:MAG: type VI secretion system-associated protein TagO [Pseudomonadota bacterium]